MKEFDLTKEYICNSCGAPLDIDEEHQVLICRYCGVTHDYAYFMQEDSLFVGYSFLEARNFKSALKTCSFILKREPHNVLALRGLLFANLEIVGWSTIHTTGFTITPAKEKVLKDCIRNAPDKHREYFELMSRSIELRKEVVELRQMINELRKRDTTHMEYDYEISDEDKIVLCDEKFKDTLRFLFFNSRGNVSRFGKFVGIVDIAGVIALICILNEVMQSPNSNLAKEHNHAGELTLWTLGIMFVISYVIPRLIWFIRGMKLKKIQRKILKSSWLVTDEEVRSEIASCQEKMESLNTRIRDINKEIRIKDTYFRSRQGN